LLALQRRGDSIQSFFGILAEEALAGTEADLSLRDRFVLVKLAYRRLHAGDLGVGLLCSLIGRIGALAGVHGVGIGVIGLGHGVFDAFCRARVNVRDLLGIFCRQFVEFVYAAANRVKLASHILFTGKGIQVSPESFVPFVLQRLFAGGAHSGLVGVLRRSCRSLRRLRVLVRRGGLRLCGSGLRLVVLT